MPTTKEKAFTQIQVLVQSFQAQYSTYRSSGYNEAQLRIDFINPLLKALGWDIDNEKRKSLYLRDVIQEETIEVEENDTLTKKNPDYTLRVEGLRKLFVEAKRVAIDIETAPKPAFQTRRYGWNASLQISVLTNFDKLIIYDCRFKPEVHEPASTARYRVFSYKQLIELFDEVYDLISFDAVASGIIEQRFSVSQIQTLPFDAFFLQQIERWRSNLAVDLARQNNLDENAINVLVQRLLNRIVFLRICEDRRIEKYATLQHITSYEELKALFLQADKRYNAGLFDFIDDELSLQVRLNTDTVISIFNELYYPQSPYDFSVVDPAILSQIYEYYLGNRITFDSGGRVSIVAEPEIVAADGVVTTPKIVVGKIVHDTLEPILVGGTIASVLQLRIADICCGSGVFLLEVYDQLLTLIAERLNKDSMTPDWVYTLAEGGTRISIWGKQQILTHCIYGLDLNPYAVEVAKFSLYLKLLEGETAATVDDHISRYKNGVLPSLEKNIKCGNALVGYNYYSNYRPDTIDDDELMYKIKPFDWFSEFPFLKSSGGFDSIVGNPPYVRIQNMARYAHEELNFYQSTTSGYVGTSTEIFDKYFLFLQRAIQLIHKTGYVGYIVPHKFFTSKNGKALREYILQRSFIHKLIHFGVTQVFPNRSTYTAILVLSRNNTAQFNFVKIGNIAKELLKEPLSIEYPIEKLSSEPWIFVSPQTDIVFNKLYRANTVPLEKIVDIPVGLQTSADSIYIFKPDKEDQSLYFFSKEGRQWAVEKKLCRPCLYDASLHLFQTVSPNAQIIFPYTLNGTRAEILDDSTFQTQFPNAWSYLLHYRHVLLNRSINGAGEPKWYQFGRSQSLTKFHNAPKLIWPVLSLQAVYAYDDSNTLFTGGGNGPYYALISNSAYSLNYILAILSHPLFEAMIKARTSPFRGGYYSHGRQFVKYLPIRKINFESTADTLLYDDIVETTRRMLETQQAFDQANLSQQRDVLNRKLSILRHHLNRQIDQLYNITEADKQTVMGDELLHVREPEE